MTQTNKPPEQNPDDDARLAALNAKLEAKKPPAAAPEEERGSAAQATRIFSELFAGLAVGGMIGYGLDHWLGTLPIFFLICLILGLAASARMIYRCSVFDRGNPPADAP